MMLKKGLSLVRALHIPSTRRYNTVLVGGANGTFNPEEIIEECAAIRASIQGLNDVSIFIS
ncbi:hypothetical protein EON65_14070 [archaeon]|nr:MAG: hypothetical protein EON65_14070 [archaeon]